MSDLKRNAISFDRSRSRHLYPTVHPFAAHDAWVLAADLIRFDDFEPALYEYCRGITEPPAMAWPVNKIFGQKLRYITCYILIGNYTRWCRFGQEPPTLSALQAAVDASPRQVAELVSSLRTGGIIIAERHETDRRSLLLKPSALLLQEVAKAPLLILAAYDRLHKQTGKLEQIVSATDDALCDWMGRSTEEYRAADILFGPFPDIVEFTDRDCGYLVLTAAMGVHYASELSRDDWKLPLTYDSLAAQFQVSRQHIANVLAYAEDRGLFSVRRGKLHAISPRLISQFETWAAGQMAHYALLAEKTSSEVEDPETV